MILGKRDNGRQVAIKGGEEIILKLPENPTTGYQWNVRASGGLRQVGDHYEHASTGAGSPGVRVLRFRTDGTGQHVLRLAYMRAWLGEESAEDSFAVTIVSG